MKRTKGLYLIIYIGILMACIAACTEVELVDTSNRVKSSLLRLEFNWQGEEADKPERMHLLAVRNVKTWRGHGFVDTDNGRNPWFGYSEPIIEENVENPESGTGEGEGAQPGTGRSRADSEGDEDQGDNEDTGSEPTPIDPDARYDFRLYGGEYNLLLVNFGVGTENMELKCLRDGKESTTTEEGVILPQEGSLMDYLNDHTRRANELFLCIKPLKERPEVVKDKDLPDFNPRFEYIDSVPRIFYGKKSGVRAVPGIDTEVMLDMEPISQEVQVKFTVELRGDENGNHIPDIVDLPIVEMSGICGHFNLMEAYVDTTTLYRSAVKAELEVDEGSRKVYKARFHTLGMLPSYNPTYLNGPGVFQVAVKAVSTDPNSPNKEGRYVYAGINPHTELTESQIIIEGPDGKPRMRFSREPVIVEIQTPLIINYKFLVDAGEGLGWGQKKPTDIDIDI